jgi:hypothetical protein
MIFTYVVEDLLFELTYLRRFMEEKEGQVTIEVHVQSSTGDKLGELAASNHQDINRLEIHSKVIYPDTYNYDWEIHLPDAIRFFQDVVLPPNLEERFYQKPPSRDTHVESPSVVIPAAGGWDVL